MLPAECAFILPDGKSCRQFALRGRRFCRFHEKSVRIEEVARREQRIRSAIAGYDLQWLTAFLLDTVDCALHHRITPARQRFIYQTILSRLSELGSQSQIADASQPDRPFYDPQTGLEELTGYDQSGQPSPHPPQPSRGSIPASRMPGMDELSRWPLPPDIDRKDWLSAIELINSFASANCAASFRPEDR
jgi:hypothetical protein